MADILHFGKLGITPEYHMHPTVLGLRLGDKNKRTNKLFYWPDRS